MHDVIENDNEYNQYHLAKQHLLYVLRQIGGLKNQNSEFLSGIKLDIENKLSNYLTIMDDRMIAYIERVQNSTDIDSVSEFAEVAQPDHEIENDAQLEVTRRAHQMFHEEVLRLFSKCSTLGTMSLLERTQINAARSMRDELQAQIDAYLAKRDSTDNKVE